MLSYGRLPRLSLALVLAGILQVPSFAAPVRNRISQQISQTQTVEVPNSVNPRVRRATDLGPLAEGTRITSMTLQFSMSAEQEAALDQLLTDQQNPASPRYHQWLTPAQFQAQFGLSSADLDKVKGWLNSQGFTVTSVANGGQFVRFTGTAAQVNGAFGTTLHSVSYNGETHFSNLSNSTLPSAIATVVKGVTGLNNFHFRSHTHAVRPLFTSSISGNHYLAPGDIYAMYGVSALTKSGIDGTGVTIAVTGQVDVNTLDLTTFRSAAGLSTANMPTTIHTGGDPGAAHNCSSASTKNCPVPNLDDLAEASIDLEWSAAMAPGATILFVNGPDVMQDAMTYAIDNNIAPIVTTSYGGCEPVWGTTDLAQLAALFKQAAAQGQTVVAASGDDGAADCDLGPSASQGLTVDFPGSSPYVTSLGGTQLNDGSGTGATQYWSNSEGSTTNGGSALGYIPEVVWNDTTSGGYGGTGGGPSQYFSKPAWQQGTGVPNDGSRDTPDISLSASDAHDQFLYCMNVSAGTSCTTGFRAADTTVNVAGGTSISSQLFGGMLALIQQKTGGARLGNVNPLLYAFGNAAKYYTPGATILTNANVVFNDITSGDNKMPCTVSTPNCPYGGGSMGFISGNGYDLATGWGSVNLINLANAWASATPLSSGSNGSAISSTKLVASPSTVAAGATVTLTATITGLSGTPSGTVQFLVNGAVVGSGTLNKGVASYTYTTSCANLAAMKLPQLPAGLSPGANTGIGAAPVVLAAGLLLLIVPRRRRLPSLFVALIAVTLMASLGGCSSGSTATSTASTGSSTTTSTSSNSSSSKSNASLVVTASYSGDSTYTGSIAAGISAAGFTTTSSAVTPITVTVTPGGC